MTWWQWALVAYVACGFAMTVRAIATRDRWLRDERWSWRGAFGLLIALAVLWPIAAYTELRQWVALQRLRTEIATSQGIPRRMISGRYVRQMTPPPDLPRRDA